MNIERFREYLSNDKVIISEHADARLQERNIAISNVISVILSGEIIEEYKEDEPFPSCLILGFIDKKPIHIVISDANNYAKIVTAYIPDKNLWYDNYKKRLIK